MENCLVTKLKASVNDNGLEKLGIIEFVVLPTTDAWTNERNIGIIASEAITITTEDSYFVDSSNNNIGQVVTLTPDVIKYCYFPTGGGTYQIRGKYYITRIDFTADIFESPLKLEWLKFSTGLTRLNGIFSGNLSSLEDCSQMTFFSARYAQNSLTGGISVFGNFSGLQTLQIPNQEGLTPESIVELGVCTSLTKLRLNRTGTTGTIEAFVASQRLNGRTTCDGIDVAYLGDRNSITFNGELVPNVAPLTLSWTATTITLGNTTINA